ncbi:MAG: hypothetical protein K5765_07910 [Clostridia bacterium]|nr:hypothetical protein [Clostridia bacterium]
MKRLYKTFFCFILLAAISILGFGCGSSSKNNVDDNSLVKPSFVGYTIEHTQVKKQYTTEEKGSDIFPQNAETDNLESQIITETMYTNPDEKLVIALKFINNERDSFIDLVINDSDYGDNQVYSSSSKINIIYSVETYKENDKWMTDVTLLMPKTKSISGERLIEVTEATFLKDAINKKMQANLKEDSNSTKLTAIITNKYVPTSKIFFEYKEVKYDNKNGYEITKIKDEYGLPSCVYIPKSIDGIEVISVAYLALLDLSLDNMVIPETITYHNDRILNNIVKYNFIILAKDVKNLVDGGDDSLVGFYPNEKIYLWEEYYNKYYFYLEEYEKGDYWNCEFIFLDNIDDIPVI